MSNGELARHVKRTITVEIYEGHGFNVREGDRYTDYLSWDEMLGTISELTHPQVGEARYRMLTAEDWQEYDAAMAARSKELATDQFEFKS